MSRQKPPPKFSFGAPEPTEPQREMPASLDIVEYDPVKLAAKKKRLAGGAYNPYENTVAVSDTARMKKPRVDLRKLSEWIKTTKHVKALRSEELPPQPKTPRRK
ncbi:MAG: hypothetical protein ABW278_06515 [Steroidobacteraceae bacterium]